jgi:hypothetical protein
MNGDCLPQPRSISPTPPITRSPRLLMPPPMTTRSTSTVSTRMRTELATPWNSRPRISSARSSPASAASSTALTALPSPRAHCRAMPEPDAMTSSPPCWPSRSIGPAGSTRMWPISPAPPRAPRQSSPRSTRPAARPVPRLRYDSDDVAGCSRRWKAPSAAALTSFSTRTGAPSRSARSAPSSRWSSPRLIAWVTRPVATSTAPGIPTPTVVKSRIASPLAAVSCAIASTVDATTARAPKPVGRRTRSTTLPSSSTATASVFVPPISTPILIVIPPRARRRAPR